MIIDNEDILKTWNELVIFHSTNQEDPKDYAISMRMAFRVSCGCMPEVLLKRC